MNIYEIGVKIENLVWKIKTEIKDQIRDELAEELKTTLSKRRIDNGSYSPYVKEWQIYFKGNCRVYYIIL